jgi:hypothetical protein
MCLSNCCGYNETIGYAVVVLLLQLLPAVKAVFTEAIITAGIAAITAVAAISAVAV